MTIGIGWLGLGTVGAGVAGILTSPEGRHPLVSQLALRRVAEASLREFASLADALDQVVWKRDHTMRRILYLSRRIEGLTGWSADELCRNPALLDDAIHPDDRLAVAAARGLNQRCAKRKRCARNEDAKPTPYNLAPHVGQS